MSDPVEHWQAVCSEAQEHVYQAIAAASVDVTSCAQRKLEAVEDMRSALAALRDYLTRELEQP